MTVRNETVLIVEDDTAVSLAYGLDIGLAEGFRKSAFDVVSALSTTGYSTMSYAEWPHFAIGVLILMMLIGGGIGSTAGGIKLSRVYLTLRLCAIQIKKKLSPGSAVASPHYIKASGKTLIDQELAEDTIGFVMVYLVIFVIGSLIMTVTADCTLMEAMFDFASSLGTVGLSIGITGPMTNDATLIVEMIGMLLGRLEIFIVVIGFTFGFGMLKDMLCRKKRS
ncbi:MAG: TrkH family potassium uptake protein [Clostridia bacterium]|nr:TrkH family potassium uptake protein [Clostridia bacterium]